MPEDPNPGPVETSGRALVLSCMDYRLIASVANYLNQRGLQGRYDQVVMAGAAVGVVHEPTGAWAATFWEHLDLAVKMHGITRVIIIDHRDCGACKVFVDPNCSSNQTRELQLHANAMADLANEIRRRQPALDIELTLMDLNGQVDRILPTMPANNMTRADTSR